MASAGSYGMPLHPPGAWCRFNWDGRALNGATEAYVILHEIAHFVLAPPARRGLVDFGLGPGPDTIDREAAERAAVMPLVVREEEEAAASLLGIIWEARLGQPALASFLDQNWIEGLERSAPCISAACSRVFGASAYWAIARISARRRSQYGCSLSALANGHCRKGDIEPPLIRY